MLRPLLLGGERRLRQTSISAPHTESSTMTSESNLHITQTLEERLAIPASKAQIIGPLVGAASSLLLLTLLFFLGWPSERGRYGVVGVLASAGGTVWFSVLILRALLRAFFSRPALLVDHEGLHGAFRLLGARSVFWGEINGFISGDDFLGINLSDARSVLSRSGPITSMSITVRQSRGDPQIEVSQKAIAEDTRALARILSERLDRWRDPREETA